MRKFLLVTIFFIFIISILGCAPDPLEVTPIGPTNGWSVFHPLPGGYDLDAVWGESPADVWAVGAHGAIVHWDGHNTKNVDSPTRAWLNLLDGHSSTDLYAAGENIVLHFDGHTWDIFHQFPNPIIKGLLCHEGGRLYVTGTMGLWVNDETGWHMISGPSGSRAARRG